MRWNTAVILTSDVPPFHRNQKGSDRCVAGHWCIAHGEDEVVGLALSSRRQVGGDEALDSRWQTGWNVNFGGAGSQNRPDRSNPLAEVDDVEGIPHPPGVI